MRLKVRVGRDREGEGGERERTNIRVGNITVIYTLRFGEFTLPRFDKNAQPLYK